MLAGALPERVERLALICRDEKIEISDSSLLAIAREADGSLRDSQTLLDQVIAYGGSKVDDEQVDVFLATLNRLGGRDVLDKRIALLARLREKSSCRDLAKLLPRSCLCPPRRVPLDGLAAWLIRLKSRVT